MQCRSFFYFHEAPHIRVIPPPSSPPFLPSCPTYLLPPVSVFFFGRYTPIVTCRFRRPPPYRLVPTLIDFIISHVLNDSLIRLSCVPHVQFVHLLKSAPMLFISTLPLPFWGFFSIRVCHNVPVYVSPPFLSTPSSLLVNNPRTFLSPPPPFFLKK